MEIQDKKDDLRVQITCVLQSQGYGVVLEQWGCLPCWWFPFVPTLSPSILDKVKDNSQKMRLLPGQGSDSDSSMVPRLPREALERSRVVLWEGAWCRLLSKKRKPKQKTPPQFCQQRLAPLWLAGLYPIPSFPIGYRFLVNSQESRYKIEAIRWSMPQILACFSQLSQQAMKTKTYHHFTANSDLILVRCVFCWHFM